MAENNKINVELLARAKSALRQSGTDLNKVVDTLVREQVNARPWTYYDTLIISPYIPAGNPAAVTFALVPPVNSFFSGRNVDAHGITVTNMTGKDGKFDVDFLCLAITADILCPGDAPAPAGGGTATAQKFVELMSRFAMLDVQFSQKPVLQRPLGQLPAGGGVYVDSKVRTQGVAAFTDSCNANNGMPTWQAVRLLEEPIAFRQSDSFSAAVKIYDGSGAAGPLAEIHALTALAGNDTAGVRISMHGIRGEDLLRGTPKP